MASSTRRRSGKRWQRRASDDQPSTTCRRSSSSALSGERGFPLRFLEPREENARRLIESEGALDQIAVLRKQFEDFVLRHTGQLVLQSKSPVIHAGGVHDRTEVSLFRLKHGFEFR